MQNRKLGYPLPYWDKNFDLDISSWIPYGVDYSPVSANRLNGPVVEHIASMAMGMDSELVFIKSFFTGSGGTLCRDHLYDPGRNPVIDLGFTMVFGYSKPMENLLSSLVSNYENVDVGLTLCGVWDRYILLDECKVLAVVSDDPFFDEDKFLVELEKACVKEEAEKDSDIAFFAEKFGYRRFSIAHETDDTLQMSISQLLFDITLDATRVFVGGPPELRFPPLLQASIVIKQ